MTRNMPAQYAHHKPVQVQNPSFVMELDKTDYYAEAKKELTGLNTLASKNFNLTAEEIFEKVSSVYNFFYKAQRYGDNELYAVYTAYKNVSKANNQPVPLYITEELDRLTSKKTGQTNTLGL